MKEQVRFFIGKNEYKTEGRIVEETEQLIRNDFFFCILVSEIKLEFAKIIREKKNVLC